MESDINCLTVLFGRIHCLLWGGRLIVETHGELIEIATRGAVSTQVYVSGYLLSFNTEVSLVNIKLSPQPSIIKENTQNLK